MKNKKIIFLSTLLLSILIIFPTKVYAAHFWEVKKNIKESINEWLKDVMKTFFDFSVSGCKLIFKQLGTTNPEITKYYALFLGFATTLVLVVVLCRIVLTMIKEADESTDVTWANIVMDSIKSAISIPVMVFLQWFLITKIISPLGNYMFSMNSKYSFSVIQGSKNPIDSAKMSMLLLIIIGGFFAIVTLIFLVKTCIFLAEMAWFNLAIPFVAISIASETFDYGMTWWKKLLYLNISLLSQVLSMTLCVWGVTHWVSDGFYAFAISVGMGFMVIHSPKVIEDFWSSVGLTKTGARGLRSLGSMMMSRRGSSS